MTTASLNGRAHTEGVDDDDIDPAARPRRRSFTAEYFDLRPAVVRAALAYYAEFKDEVDADVAWARVGEEEERARWERERAALA